MSSKSGGTLFRMADASGEINRAQSLLLFQPSWSLNDGATPPVSEGFIDGQCFPPWDTWLAMVSQSGGEGNALITWVPEWASPLVNDAIQVDPAGCLCWIRSEEDHLWKLERGKAWPNAG
jgi:hypothetical protein